jgi:sec-independent protein translocase protein TatC
MPLDQPPSRITERVDDARMSFGDHLEELRRRIIYALVGVVVASAVTFYYGFNIISWLAGPLLQAEEALGYVPQAYAFDPTAGFTSVYLKVSLIAAVIVASPWVIYQVWRFVISGLYEHERRAVYVLWPFSATMTVLGVLFTYYILLPVCLMFFLSFAAGYPPIEPSKPGFMIRMLTPRAPSVAESGAATKPAEAQAAPQNALQLPMLDEDPVKIEEGMIWINRRDGRPRMFLNGKVQTLLVQPNRLLSPMPEISQYVGFAAWVGLGIVLAFQLPVAMLVLAWTGLIDPKVIARFRKYALFACFAVAAVLTPTDLLSMFVLGLPLYGLFEFGLLTMKFVYRGGDGP